MADLPGVVADSHPSLSRLCRARLAALAHVSSGPQDLRVTMSRSFRSLGGGLLRGVSGRGPEPYGSPSFSRRGRRDRHLHSSREHPAGADSHSTWSKLEENYCHACGGVLAVCGERAAGDEREFG